METEHAHDMRAIGSCAEYAENCTLMQRTDQIQVAVSCLRKTIKLWSCARELRRHVLFVCLSVLTYVVPNVILFQKVVHEAVKRLESFNTQNLSNLSWSFAMQTPTSPLNVKLFDALAAISLEKMEYFNERVCVHISTQKKWKHVDEIIDTFFTHKNLPKYETPLKNTRGVLHANGDGCEMRPSKHEWVSVIYEIDAQAFYGPRCPSRHVRLSRFPRSTNLRHPNVSEFRQGAENSCEYQQQKLLRWLKKKRPRNRFCGFYVAATKPRLGVNY